MTATRQCTFSSMVTRRCETAPVEIDVYGGMVEHRLLVTRKTETRLRSTRIPTLAPRLTDTVVTSVGHRGLQMTTIPALVSNGFTRERHDVNDADRCTAEYQVRLVSPPDTVTPTQVSLSGTMDLTTDMDEAFETRYLQCSMAWTVRFRVHRRTRPARSTNAKGTVQMAMEVLEVQPQCAEYGHDQRWRM